MLYLDTSVLVSLHVGEAHSAQTLQWFALQSDQHLVISDFVKLEFACALRRKVRAGRLSHDDAARADLKFASTVESALSMVDVPGSCFRRATALVKQSEVPLRAADALHLAIAQAHGAALATLDVKLGDAARAFDTQVASILSDS